MRIVNDKKCKIKVFYAILQLYIMISLSTYNNYLKNYYYNCFFYILYFFILTIHMRIKLI